MRYKFLKYIFLACSFFLVVFLILSKSNPNRKKETYFRYLSKDKFLSKLQNSSYLWMDKQIDSDLEFLKDHKVTQKALEETFFTMKKKFIETKRDFYRYRIINNELFLFFDSDDFFFTKKEDAFEKAIKTLLRLKKIPDVDFVFSNIDGLSTAKRENDILFYYENRRDFYLTEDRNLQAPIFTRAKNKNVKEGILVPDYVVLSELWPKLIKEILELNDKNSWQEKINKVYWRGASSKLCRFKLCEASIKNKKIIDAGFAEEVNQRKIDELKRWNKYDSYFQYQKSYSTYQEQLNYKYLPVLDGVMCTYPGYQWRLLSNSLAFKQNSSEIQWFYGALVPYVHYLPIKEDFSDIVEQINWAQIHDEKCKKISQNATEFVLNNLMIEDAYFYLYKLFLKYSKYQNFDKNFLKINTKKDPRWISISNRKKANKILKKRK